MHNQDSVLENETYTPFGDFEIHLSQISRLSNSKRKGTSRIVDIAVPADHGVKVKESKKKYYNLDLAKELN